MTSRFTNNGYVPTGKHVKHLSVGEKISVNDSEKSTQCVITGSDIFCQTIGLRQQINDLFSTTELQEIHIDQNETNIADNEAAIDVLNTAVGGAASSNLLVKDIKKTLDIGTVTEFVDIARITLAVDSSIQVTIEMLTIGENGLATGNSRTVLNMLNYGPQQGVTFSGPVGRNSNHNIVPSPDHNKLTLSVRRSDLTRVDAVAYIRAIITQGSVSIVEL